MPLGGVGGPAAAGRAAAAPPGIGGIAAGIAGGGAGIGGGAAAAPPGIGAAGPNKATKRLISAGT